MSGKFKREDGNFLYHTSCDACGSSDANAVYDTDTSYCFSCQKWDVLEKRPAPEKNPDFSGLEVVITRVKNKAIAYCSWEASKYKWMHKGRVLQEGSSNELDLHSVSLPSGDFTLECEASGKYQGVLV